MALCRRAVLSFHALRASGYAKGRVRFLSSRIQSAARHEGRALSLLAANTVEITPRRVDARGFGRGKTAAIARTLKLVARIGGPARKSAA